MNIVMTTIGVVYEDDTGWFYDVKGEFEEISFEKNRIHGDGWSIHDDKMIKDVFEIYD